MQTITIKNVPINIHKSLKNIARFNRRSLNNEIIYCLEKYTTFSKINSKQLIIKARNTREKISHLISDSDIKEAKNEGRK